jgi:hypothetical protein
MGEQKIIWEVVCMTGMDDGSLEIPTVATQILWTQLTRASGHFPPDMVKWTSIRSRHPLEEKESNADIQRL